jgi:hypothetical protein
MHVLEVISAVDEAVAVWTLALDDVVAEERVDEVLGTVALVGVFIQPNNLLAIEIITLHLLADGLWHDEEGPHVRSVVDDDCEVACHWSQPEERIDGIEWLEGVNELEQCQTDTRYLVHHRTDDIALRDVLVEEGPNVQCIIHHCQSKDMAENVQESNEFLL